MAKFCHSSEHARLAGAHPGSRIGSFCTIRRNQTCAFKSYGTPAGAGHNANANAAAPPRGKCSKFSGLCGNLLPGSHSSPKNSPWCHPERSEGSAFRLSAVRHWRRGAFPVCVTTLLSVLMLSGAGTLAGALQSTRKRRASVNAKKPAPSAYSAVFGGAGAWIDRVAIPNPSWLSATT
jgi:hypothetical protein